jgi:hypothetical protein
MLIALAPRTQDLGERLLEKIDRRGPNDCWPWTAGHTRYGYGYIRLGKKTVSAHRAVFALTHTLNDTTVVRHSCDNRLCCNPGHLLAGTQQDNIDDMMKRGRYGRWRKREPRRESEAFGNQSEAFVIKSKASGKYLTTKASLFGPIEDANQTDAMVGIGMTREDKRLAKNAAWRAAQGLPPKMPIGARPVREICRQRKRVPSWIKSGPGFPRDPDGLDRDDLGLSPDF